jgi:4-aminobutyrate aminotransferase-like enzyme
MGWCVGNFGWRPQATTKAIERFKGPDYVYPGYSYAPWTELARLLASLAPRPLTTCFRATGGSEAVDLALQAALIHTGRRGFLSLEGSYHGNSLAGLSIGASDSRERIKNLTAALRQDRPAAGCQGAAPDRAAAEAARTSPPSSSSRSASTSAC